MNERNPRDELVKHVASCEHCRPDRIPHGQILSCPEGRSLFDALQGEDVMGQGGYFKCPACGYWAFDGNQCWDCGFRRRVNAEEESDVRV